MEVINDQAFAQKQETNTYIMDAKNEKTLDYPNDQKFNKVGSNDDISEIQDLAQSETYKMSKQGETDTKVNNNSENSVNGRRNSDSFHFDDEEFETNGWVDQGNTKDDKSSNDEFFSTKDDEFDANNDFEFEADFEEETISATQTTIPLFQQSPEDVAQTLSDAFSNTFEPKTSSVVVNLNKTLFDYLLKPSSSMLLCKKCKFYTLYKNAAFCLLCGTTRSDLNREKPLLPIIRGRFADALKIIPIDEDEEEDYFDTQKRISIQIDLKQQTRTDVELSKIKMLHQRTSGSNTTILLPTVAVTEKKGHHTDKYGFIVDKPSAEREKYEQISEKNELDSLPKWAEQMKLFGSEQFFTNTNPLKQFIRDGIPSEHRTRVWLHCTGAGARWSQYQGYYKTLLTNNADKTSEAIKTIDKDIARTLATNVFFREESTREALRRILVAFSWHNTRIGYCQGLAFIAGILLLLMKEEPAFWLFVTIVEKLLPEEYFTETLIAARVDQLVFTALIAKKLPHLYKHFQAVSLNLNAVFYGWFICLYVNVLPVETILRVWDVFFNEGNKILFRVGLALLKRNEKEILAAQEDNMIYAILKKMPGEAFDSDSLLQTSFNEIGSFPMRNIRNLRQKFRPQVLAEFLVEPGSQ